MTSLPSPYEQGAGPATCLDLVAIGDLVHRARSWLLNSGIQDRSHSPQRKGGFYAWYDAEMGSYPFLYAEATGYLITALSASNQPMAVEKARCAADWLVREMFDPEDPEGGFRCLQPAASDRFIHKQRYQYAFDNGVILNGLGCLYRTTGEQKYLEVARGLADWLIQMQLPNGGFHAMRDGKTGDFVNSKDEWSTQPGPHQGKVAIGLHHIGDLLEDDRLHKAAIRACEFTLGFQLDSGRFLTLRRQGCTNSHPHAYAAEALWSVGQSAGREDFLQASARATHWLLEHMSATGEIPRLCNENGLVYNERVDTTAQTLRLAILHLAADRLPRHFEGSMHRLAQLLATRQSLEGDLRSFGGFHFGKLSNGKELRNVNSWVSAFAMQALELYRGLRIGRVSLVPFHLV